MLKLKKNYYINKLELSSAKLRVWVDDALIWGVPGWWVAGWVENAELRLTSVLVWIEIQLSEPS